MREPSLMCRLGRALLAVTPNFPTIFIPMRWGRVVPRRNAIDQIYMRLSDLPHGRRLAGIVRFLGGATPSFHVDDMPTHGV
jgi:hypothetical protein